MGPVLMAITTVPTLPIAITTVLTTPTTIVPTMPATIIVPITAMATTTVRSVTTATTTVRSGTMATRTGDTNRPGLCPITRHSLIASRQPADAVRPQLVRGLQRKADGTCTADG